MSAATNGKTTEDFRGRLREIGGTKFEADRPRADLYSHGYWCQRYHLSFGSHTPLGQRPGEFGERVILVNEGVVVVVVLLVVVAVHKNLNGMYAATR